MGITPLKKFIITSIILLALIAGLSFAFVIISNNVRAYHDTLALTAAKISSGEKSFTHMITISDLMKNHAEDIGHIKHVAIDPRRPLPFIETIEKIGRTTNVKITLTVDEKKENTPSLLFHAILVGTENNVHTILALIQHLPYQIKIENFSFQRDVPLIFSSKQITSSTITHLILTMRVATQQ